MTNSTESVKSVKYFQPGERITYTPDYADSIISHGSTHLGNLNDDEACAYVITIATDKNTKSEINWLKVRIHGSAGKMYSGKNNRNCDH